MLNIIRTTPGRIKYCGRTVDALIASNRHQRTDIHIISDPNPDSMQNAIAQLEFGVKSGEEWFVTLEDDVEFISDFNESVELWLRDCERIGTSPFYPLAAAYPDILKMADIAWRWPIGDFYGTQAVVFHRADALRAVEFLRTHPNPDLEFDLQLADWAGVLGKTHILTPCPSFVQHVGISSAIMPGSFHWYAGFAGSEWSYSRGHQKPCFCIKSDGTSGADDHEDATGTRRRGQRSPVFDHPRNTRGPDAGDHGDAT